MLRDGGPQPDPRERPLSDGARLLLEEDHRHCRHAAPVEGCALCRDVKVPVDGMEAAKA